MHRSCMSQAGCRVESARRCQGPRRRMAAMPQAAIPPQSRQPRGGRPTTTSLRLAVAHRRHTRCRDTLRVRFHLARALLETPQSPVPIELRHSPCTSVTPSVMRRKSQARAMFQSRVTVARETAALPPSPVRRARQSSAAPPPAPAADHAQPTRRALDRAATDHSRAVVWHRPCRPMPPSSPRRSASPHWCLRA